MMTVLAVVSGAGSSPTKEALAQASASEYRSIDGSGNNVDHPHYGSAGIQLLRLARASYADGTTAKTPPELVGARQISNSVVAQTESIPNEAGASGFAWQWGQFLDHDIDLTPQNNPLEPLPIRVPTGDPFFDPEYTGTQVIPFHRSAFDPGTGTGRNDPRQQLNLITSFIDASNVYGSDEARASALRAHDGTGKLATSGGGRYLPLNTGGWPNAGGPDPSLFLAGDVRANEQVYLTALHTLFLREHNRLCDEIADESPELSGEEIFQRARRIVGALMQVITYREFLPVLLGPDALPPYAGYAPDVDPAISNEFSTAAYRFGHSMLPAVLLRLNRGGNETRHVSLEDAFFNPHLMREAGGIESLLRGLAAQRAEEVDTKLVDGVRNFLFGLPGEGGFDLASLNIQRGRDHGLASYNGTRRALGLRQARRFADVTPDPDLQAALEELYASVDDLDLWTAGLAEVHVEGALVGETHHAILLDQFVRLRDGDRFWYRNDEFFTSKPELLDEVENTTLADVVRRNTRIRDELPDGVFVVE